MYYYISVMYHRDIGYGWVVKWLLLLYIPTFYVFFGLFRKVQLQGLRWHILYQTLLWLLVLIGWTYLYLHIILPRLGIQVLVAEVPFSWREFLLDVLLGCFRMACYAGIAILATVLYRQRKDYIRLLSKRKQAKLQSLGRELSSHTQFDLLHRLYTKVGKERPELEQYILDLADIQGYSSLAIQRPLVPLVDELEKVEQLAKMMNADYFGQHEDWLIVQGDYRSCQVPAMMLLNLLENACKYGDMRQRDSLSLRVTIVEQQLAVLCKNRVAPSKSHRKSLGIGNENLRERLLLLFADGVSFETFERSGFFYAQIHINPIQTH